MLRVGSALLVLWGVITIIGGLTAGRAHPASLIGPAFTLAGALTAWGGALFAMRRKWAFRVTVTGLAAISLVALKSAYLLHGWAEMNVLHHVTRLAISASLLTLAVFGLRRREKLARIEAARQKPSASR